MTMEHWLEEVKKESAVKGKVPGLSLPKFVTAKNKNKLPAGVVLPDDLLPSDTEEKLPAGAVLPKDIIDN